MSEPQISFAYPVDWPLSRPRTQSRKPALFKSNRRSLLFDDAVGRLREQVSLVTMRGQPWRMRELTLSTNFQLRAEIDAAWRRKIASAHPDQGGSTAAAARINLARDEGRKANG